MRKRGKGDKRRGSERHGGGMEEEVRNGERDREE